MLLKYFESCPLSSRRVASQLRGTLSWNPKQFMAFGSHTMQENLYYLMIVVLG